MILGYHLLGVDLFQFHQFYYWNAVLHLSTFKKVLHRCYFLWMMFLSIHVEPEELFSHVWKITISVTLGKACPFDIMFYCSNPGRKIRCFVHIIWKTLVLWPFKAWVCYLLPNFYFFTKNDSPSKTMKNVFFSSKKLFLLSRYSNFCSFLPSSTHFPDSKGQMEVE